LSPVVLAALVARVVAGDGSAPTLVAIVAAAAVIGLLVPPPLPRAITRITPVAQAPVALGWVFVLAANLIVLGDVARLFGLPRAVGLAAGLVLALGVIGWTAGDRWWRLATPLGCAFVLLPLAPVVSTGGPPWTAWASMASRAALTFTEQSAWVTQGRALGEHVTVTFREPHRVVAASSGTWRVVERDAALVAVREWQLGHGDALTLRPGDELLVDPGTRVRFEAGRRVPGAPPSGIAWADGADRPRLGTLLLSAGAVVTLVGGGVALAPALPVAGAMASIAPAVLLAFVLGAALWGLYGAALVPELSLTPAAVAPLIEVLARTAPFPWRPGLLGLVVLGVLALFIGASLAWRARLFAALTDSATALGQPALSARARTAAAAVVLALATALAVRGGDPWRLFGLGLGLAAAAVIAPRLAATGPRGEAAGAVVGMLAFGATLFGDAWGLPPAPGPVVEHPAMIAAPLAWLAARLARRRA
jgi:hypothetical protein